MAQNAAMCVPYVQSLLEALVKSVCMQLADQRLPIAVKTYSGAVFLLFVCYFCPARDNQYSLTR